MILIVENPSWNEINFFPILVNNLLYDNEQIENNLRTYIIYYHHQILIGKIKILF